ncbi:MAG: ABC transporter substrate-binding protein, partial [Chloroflexi bacterium]|nr:ABC transporter substrate-binding protein [Chloroflexota bacterium]
MATRAVVALAAAAVVLTATACSGSGSDDARQSQDPASEATTVADAAGPAAPGVYDQRVIFGQSAAFSGPAQELGRNMQLGIQAAFHEANQRGGVHGRLLELSSLDDAYEPEAAIANTLQLIDEDVFALIGAVGTPTSRSAVPVAESAGVPYIAPFTG